MKKIISLLLACIMLLTGCGIQNSNTNNTELSTSHEDNHDNTSIETDEINFPTLNDENLLNYIESNVYTDLIDKLDSDEYFIENITAKYISKEYLEEVAYNSQANIYFGFTLEELQEQFDGSKFIFTLGDDGKTTVKEFEAYDDTYDKVIRNVATGAGVILICTTISAISATTGVAGPAVSTIFAASAKTGTIVALSDGVISGVVAGVVNGIQTKDFDKALDVAALAGSDGFKWGALSGVVLGGATKAFELKGLTLNGLTMNEAATIQRESKCSPEFIKSLHSMDEYNNLKYPPDIIRSLHSIDEYNIFQQLKLKPKVVNGKTSLVQKIDWDFIGDVADGRTNRQRVEAGLAPLDPSGKSYNLHHIGQKQDSPLAILTDEQHKGYNSILHANTGQKPGEVDHGNPFAKQKHMFWSSILEMSNK